MIIEAVGRASALMAMAWHPGHGVEGSSYQLSHYLTEPVHAGIALAIMLVVLVGVFWIRLSRVSEER